MAVTQHALSPVLQRLEVASACLEDAEVERDAAIAASLTCGLTVARVAEIAGIPASAVLEIARTWSVATSEE